MNKYEKTLVNTSNKSIKMHALDNAYNTFLKKLKEYNSQTFLSEKEYNIVLNKLKEVYKEKKAAYFLEEKINQIFISNSYI